MHDETNRLWLQEYADHAIVSFMDGRYQLQMGEYVRPERLLIVPGDIEHGLRLMDEPIEETLQREREEALARADVQ